MILIDIFSRIINFQKINYFKKIIEDDYNLNWKNKSWEDYAIDCVKLASELINGPEIDEKGNQIKKQDLKNYFLALKEKRNKELEYAKEKLSKIPNSEYKIIFNENYLITIDVIKKDDFNNVTYNVINMSGIINQYGKELKYSYNVWFYIKIILYLDAVENVYGNKFDNIIDKLDLQVL